MRCKHCGGNIRRHNMTGGGPTWFHQPEGSAFMDRAEQGCPSTTVAEPREETN